MPVSKRKSKNGGQTNNYHYAFAYNGKRYRGVCKKCTTKKEAEEYEKAILATVKKAGVQKNIRAFVENFRDELTGGSQITLADAYELSLEKPKKRAPSDELVKIKRSYWLDFADFMSINFNDTSTLSNVQPKHAEAYILHLRKYGNFKKTYKPDGEHLTIPLSPKTINTYQQTLHEVFQLLGRDAGIIDNPFSAVPKLDQDSESREAFTEEELSIIRDKLDDFTRPLFTIAISTALREGDICTLKWDEIDLENGVIFRSQMRKTGHAVEIPMMPPLHEYLSRLKSESVLRPENEYTEYVLPEHARMYLTNRTGVSYRIKSFLESCGIKTTKVPKGRTRAISVKDLHSCRHTFCYYAGLYGIPMNIVQGIVGHMTPEMTKHYSAHASLEAKREKMKLLPAFMAMSVNESITEIVLSEREQLKQIINQLKPEDINSILKFIKSHLV